MKGPLLQRGKLLPLRVLSIIHPPPKTTSQSRWGLVKQARDAIKAFNAELTTVDHPNLERMNVAGVGKIRDSQRTTNRRGPLAL
jgi:hypothetical protein